jgi:hypothetical protein
MGEFARIPQKFRFRGIHLNSPVDSLPPGKVPFAMNIRSRVDGRIEARSGLVPTSSPMSAGPHSIRRLNNYLPGTPGSIHVIGAGTELFYATLPGSATSADVGYSGNPLSLIPFRPEESSESWMYVFDSLRMRKINVGALNYRIGIFPSNQRPVVAVDGAGSLNNTASQPYFYRFRYRSTITGSRSNPSPPSPDPGLTVSGNKIDINCSPSGDGQVGRIDIFRFGGTVTTWRLIGSVDNSAAAFHDDMPDDVAQLQEELSFDNYPPFIVQDKTRSGTCNVSGTFVTQTGGDPFNPNWPDGTTVSINGVPKQTIGSPATFSTMEVYAPPMGVLTGVPWTAESPNVMSTPLPCAWGPYGGGSSGEFIFAVGDQRRPGTIYWTNGNDPDSMAISNYLEITSPSERLQNGCMFDGSSYVWSPERMWVVRPAFSSGGIQFNALEVPAGRGLHSRWCLCVGNAAMYFLAHDGIYMTTGGTPVCITDEDLYPLFPHEGVPGITVNEIYPPDMENELGMRLSFADGLLYFDYLIRPDLGSGATTLVWNPATKAWMYDNYFSHLSISKQVLCRYDDEFPNSDKVYIGTAADIVFSMGGGTDGSSDIDCRVRTPSIDGGDSRSLKHWGDVMVDCDSGSGNFSVNAGFNNYATLGPVVVFGAPGLFRKQHLIDLTTGGGTLARNICLEIDWAASQGASLYEWQPSVLLDKPVESRLRATDWEDAGVPGRKLVRGIILEADTYGFSFTINLEKDGITGPYINISHNGQQEKTYGFPEFEATELRIQPTDPTVIWRLFKWKWIFDPYPSDAQMADVWSDAGQPGDKYFFGVLIEANTQNIGTPVSIETDADTSGTRSVVVTADKREERAYYFDPIVAHRIRLHPLGTMQLFKVTWLWTPYAEISQFSQDFSNDGTDEEKYLYGFQLEATTGGGTVGINLQTDGNAFVTTEAFSAAHIGKEIHPYRLSTPKIVRSFRLVPLGDIRIFSIKWLWTPYADNIGYTYDFTDDNQPAAKYLYGCIVEGDTGSTPNTLGIQIDGVTANFRSVSAFQPGRREVAYSFDPLICHSMRVVPAQENFRLWKVRWLYDLIPERAQFTPDLKPIEGHGARQVRGFILEADTNGDVVPVQFWKDGLGVETINIRHIGRVEEAYSVTPTRGHEWRLVPTAPWRFYSVRWIYDEWPELAPITTEWDHSDELGPKYLRGVILEADTAGVTVSTEVQYDGGISGAVFQANHPDRTQITYAFNPPFTGSNMRFAPHGNMRIFRWKWIADPYPPLTAAVTAWEDAGTPSAKFIQGVLLTADTAGVPITIDIHMDNEQFARRIVGVDHVGKTTTAYTFEPFIAHNLRMLSLSPWRYFGAHWIWEPVPELALLWQTQGTNHDLPGFLHLRRAQIALVSSAGVVFTVNVDGTDFQYTFESTAGQYRKLALPAFHVAKGKLLTYRLESAEPFRLFLKDTEVHVKSWGSTEPYAIVHPFGDIHRASGARI